MPLKFTTHPTRPADTQTVTIGETQYRMRLTFRARTASWYMDLSELDGTAIILGARVSPSWGPLFKIPRTAKPDGEFTVVGPDPYSREMFTQSGQLNLFFSLTSEIPPAPAGPVLTVTIP